MSNMKEHHFIEEALLIPQEPIKIPVEVKVPENGILVERTYYERGTHGLMTFPDGTTFFTLERPWLKNERRISCIPEGIYRLALRLSPVVERTSGGEFKRGYEVVNVKDRTFIMIHPGNYVRNSEGCPLIGRTKGFQNGEPVVWSSRDAFRDFMKKMATREDWQIRFKEAK